MKRASWFAATELKCLPPSAEPGKFRQRFAIPADARVILFLGRLVAKKSPDVLIAAFARWRAKAGGTTQPVLVLAGPEEDADYARRLHEQCTEMRLGDAVRFTGPLYGDETGMQSCFCWGEWAKTPCPVQ